MTPLVQVIGLRAFFYAQSNTYILKEMMVLDSPIHILHIAIHIRNLKFLEEYIYATRCQFKTIIDETILCR